MTNNDFSSKLSQYAANSPQADPQPSPAPEPTLSAGAHQSPEPTLPPMPMSASLNNSSQVFSSGSNTSAELFSSSTEVRSDKKDLAEDGFLGWMNRVFGTKFARTSDELDLDQWVSDINAGVRRPKVVAVVSPNGSTGKSSTTQILGSTLAHYRSSNSGVVGIDIDASSILATRMRPATSRREPQSVGSFARDVANGTVRTSPDVGSYLVSNSDRFSVLPGVGHTGHRNISTPELLTAVNKLAEFNDLIFLDFPGSREVPVAEDALMWADAMVFVVETNKTSLDSAYHMLSQLQHANPELLQHTIVLLNNRSGGRVLPDMDTAISQMRQRIGASENDPRVFQVAHDQHIYESGELERSKTSPATQRRYVEIAAALMCVLDLNEEPKFVARVNKLNRHSRGN